MEPETIGRQVKQIYPQYADMPDAQLGISFLRKYGQNEAIMKSLGFDTAEEDVDEDKQALEQKIAIAERLWFPNEDKLAMDEQGNLIQRKAHKAKKQLEASTEYENYRRLVRTMGATLAKAAGDTGNIAWAEQAAQLQAMADADMTKEEAELAFKNVREGLGIEQKGDDYYNALREGKVPKITEGVNPDEAASAGLTEFVEPKEAKEKTGGDKATQEVSDEIKEIADLSLPQRIFGTAEETAEVDIPGSRFAGEAGAVAGLAIPLPPGLRTLLGGSIGQTVENVGEEGIPLTREAATEQRFNKPAEEVSNAEKVLASLGGLAGPIGMFATQPDSREMLKDVAPEAALDVLLTGGGITGNLSKIRKAVAQRSPARIPGNRIAEAAMEAAENAPASVRRPATRTAMDAVSRFGDDTLSLPQAIKARTASGKVSRTLAKGDVRAGGANLVEEAIRKALRGEIRGASKTVGVLDDVLSKTIGTGKGLSRYFSPFAISNAASSALTIEALRRAGAFSD